MNDKREILELISKDFCIFRGNHESIVDYECRLIYSLIGYMGYSALWDESDTDDGTVSIVLFKSKIKEALEAYQAIFPKIEGRFNEEISDDIYETLLSSGCIYHSNYRIRACAENAVHFDGITLCRGRVPEGDLCVSGLGTYYRNVGTNDGIDDVLEYFSINRHTLREYYWLLMKNASFSNVQEMTFEYLRTRMLFTNGYWIEKPDSDGVTIARSGAQGNYLYYLVKGTDIKSMCQLPNWMVESGEYRTIANSIMSERGTLPESKYIVDGSIVRLSIGYLYPNEEMSIVKLYSWPADYIDKSKDYNRVFSYDVFFRIKSLFESIGYKFVEEK